MIAPCPSDLALEAFLLRPERSPLRAHLDACAACRARVVRMEAEGEEFRRAVFPATVAAIEEAASRRRRPRWTLLFAPVGALAVAAAALLVVRTGPATPPPDYVGTKGGGGLGLGVYVGGEDGARRVEDGAAVPAAGALRFKVTPATAACRLWIVSVDAEGQVSRIFPPAGERAEPRGEGEVPGGARLDGRAGPERVFAVCAGEATGWGDVQRAAAATGSGPDAVRRARALGAPLADAPQSTLLVEKTR